MKMNVCFLSTMLLVSLAVSGCINNTPLPKTSKVKTDASTEYKMPTSGFTFPTSVAGFDRGTTTQYDSAGKDVSVGYNMDLPPIKATVYVYEIPSRLPAETLDKHFKFRKSEVKRSHPVVKLVSQGPTKQTIGSTSQTGLKATYSYAENLFGTRRDVLSEVRLFTHSGWFVLYLITYPKVDQATCEPIVLKFMHELEWPPKTN